MNRTQANHTPMLFDVTVASDLKGGVLLVECMGDVLARVYPTRTPIADRMQ